MRFARLVDLDLALMVEFALADDEMAEDEEAAGLAARR